MYNCTMTTTEQTMTTLPQNTTKTFVRRRVQILKTGVVHNQWSEYDKNGTIYVDAYGYSQYKAGEYRIITETETRTVTYAVEE